MVFRYFRKIIQEGGRTWTEASISKPRPTVRDFEGDFVTIPRYLLDSVYRHLDTTGLCLIVGSGSSGKTWLTYRIAYRLSFEEQKHVWYASVDENFREKDAWKEIAHYYEDKISDIVYFIVEDAHLNPDEVEKFLLRIYDRHESNTNLRFIFNTRRVGRYILRDDKIQDTFCDIFNERLNCTVTIARSHIRAIAEGMVRNFAKMKGIDQDLSEERLGSIIEEWGSDLYIVYLCLRSWDQKNNSSLVDVNRERIHAFLWDGGGEIRLCNKNQSDILCRIAAICQFEPLKIPDSLVRVKSVDENELSDLIRRGTVQVYPTNFMGISEGLARLVLSTMIAKDKNFRTRYVKNLFRDYVKFALKSEDSARWSVIFRALFFAVGGRSELAEEIMKLLVEDKEIWDATIVKAQSLTPGKLGSLVMNISHLAPNAAKELKLKYLSQNYPRIVARLKSYSINGLTKSLPLMARVIDLNQFFNEFSTADYQDMMKRSGEGHSVVNALRILFLRLEKWGFYWERRKLAEALVLLSESDLAEMIARKCNSLFRLGDLIKKIRSIDSSDGPIEPLWIPKFSIAEEFVKKLSELDLNNLFLREDIPAKEAGLSKSAVITFFLSSQISFAKGYDEKIVVSITNATWLSLLESAKLSDTFWLLWSIYSRNKEKAQDLVKEGLTLSLMRKKIDSFEKNVRRLGEGSSQSVDEPIHMLSLLGLLIECGFDISFLLLPREIVAPNLDELMESFRQQVLDEKFHPPLFVFSLIAISANKRKEYQDGIKSALAQEPLHTAVYLYRVTHIREIFKELVKKYALDE